MMAIKKNLGTVDRLIRLISRIILVYLGYFVINIALIKVLLVAMGVIGIIESFISYCGIYRLLGLNTFRGR